MPAPWALIPLLAVASVMDAHQEHMPPQLLRNALNVRPVLMEVVSTLATAAVLVPTVSQGGIVA